MSELPAWYDRDRVKAFQRRHRLTVDGWSGPKTWETIERLEGDAVTEPRIKRAYSYGGPPLRRGIDRDPRNLLPGFAATLETLFQRMRARNLEPLLWEGVRSPERADELEARGTGASGRRSMHLLGAAADIIDANLYWDAEPAFWWALGLEAEALGLTWGGRFRTRVDRPHVQAIPVAEQDAFRAMTREQRAARVA